ncbi:hypothetical protein GBAR_LOCUS30809 [Geodia barretti]|uniref:Uncharacterized protein n=1 Tax=Geodia barretti TaxID=519541 RepID=A0AA35U0T1_GEOBA|nr:hypothetical protein GBAR_LOCUS30809 [Geodia barretti]
MITTASEMGKSAERKRSTAEGIHFSPTREVGRAGSHAGWVIVPIPFHWEDAKWHGDCKVWCGGRILCQLGEGDVTIFTEASDPSAVPESHLPSPHLPCNQRWLLHSWSSFNHSKICSSSRQRSSVSSLSRPPLLLTEDGSRIRNLWYIPHTTEILTMFSEGALEDRVTRLKTILSLGRPLVMALWYQVSYVRLGTCEEGRERGFGGDWGGTEGIGNVVQRLQNEIADLPDPSDPQQVYTPFFRFLRMHITRLLRAVNP